MNIIHPTAVVDPKAILGNNCKIGPYCIIEKDVVLGNDNVLHSNVLLAGNTKIGRGNSFFHSAVVGTDCQDLKYKGEPTELIIGDNNVFREFCTINRSATMDEPTSIGSNCLFMAYSHVAHNCRLGNNIIMANAVNLAGHVHIQDFVTIGGMSAVSQFTTIGAYAFVGGKAGISKDVPPFTRGGGYPYTVVGINSVGLQRRGFSNKAILAIKEVFKIFYRSDLNVSQALEKAHSLQNLTAEQKILIDFVKNSERGIVK